MRAREREKMRLSRPIHILRADVKLQFKDTAGTALEVKGRALLNDFSTNGIVLYTDRSLAPNLELNLVIENPQPFQLNGKVVWCQYQPSSNHVITSEPYAYRIGIAFRFADKTQEEAFQNFCKEMYSKYDTFGVPSPVKKEEEKNTATAEAKADTNTDVSADTKKEEAPAATATEAPQAKEEETSQDKKAA